MKGHTTPLFALIITLLCSCTVNLFAQNGYQSVHYSGLYNGDQMDILLQTERNTSVIHQVGANTQTSPMSMWNGNTSWQTATITMGDNNNIGFYSETPDRLITPMFWDGTGAPPLSYYTPLDTDIIGDHLFTSAWLDITETKVCFSQDRIYFAMKNNYNSFPVNSGLTYFAYMPVIIDPTALPEDNPTVYGLMYTVNVAGIMSPGLYKITGSGFADLSRIGNIETSVADQTLILSCAIADLLADADFASWYNLDSPLFSASATSSKISLISGSQQADFSPGAKVSLTPIVVSTTNSFPPLLTEPFYAFEPGEQPTIMASIKYSDADGNFPRLATLSIDDGEELPLLPDSGFLGDFVGGERFTSDVIALTNSWDHIRFRFSHGDAFVYYNIQSTAASDDTQIPQPKPSLSPNPAMHQLKLTNLPSSSTNVYVYDLKGRKVLTQATPNPQDELQLDISHLPSGVYFLKSSINGSEAIRFVKIK